MQRTLHLTSPTMKGADVKHAQVVLATNVLKADFMHGSKADGEFGPETAQACARAHYWIGDIASQPVIGQRLLDYLTGAKKIEGANARRRADRLAVAAKQSIGEKMLAEMVSHIGLKESPSGSNVVMFNEWYYGLTHEQATKMWTPGSPGPPWCAVAVTYCAVKAKSLAFRRDDRYAYVPYVVADARRGLNYLSITHTPHAGDLVCYDWNGDGVADHIGIFESWRDQAKGTFIAVEGNTSYGNDSNGGEVMRRGVGTDTRRTSQVQAFVHVSG